jgi:hypothetical protein
MMRDPNSYLNRLTSVYNQGKSIKKHGQRSTSKNNGKNVVVQANGNLRKSSTSPLQVRPKTANIIVRRGEE